MATSVAERVQQGHCGRASAGLKVVRLSSSFGSVSRCGATKRKLKEKDCIGAVLSLPPLPRARPSADTR